MKGKLIQKIVGVALGLTMAIGVGVAVSNTSKNAARADAGDNFELVTNVSSLSANDTVVIGSATSGSIYLISTNQATNNRTATGTFTVSNNKIISNANVQELTLGKSGDNWTLYTGSGYLYAASSSKNYLKTQATNDANGEWTISITNTGAATITAQGSNTHNILKYNANNGSPIFSCYTTSGTVAIYKRVVAANVTITYDANEGTVSPTSQTVAAGTSVTLPTPTRSGYVFDGWQVNGAGTYYQGGESYTVNAATTMVAHWTEVRTPESLSLSGYTTTYSVNDLFAFDGIATVTYTNHENADVTSKVSVSSPDMSTTGKKTITVSYTENNVEVEAEYEITVNKVSSVTFTPGTDVGATSVTKNGITASMTTMNNASYYQIYANESGTFTSTIGNISKIEFECTASGTSKYGPGNTSADVGNYAYSGAKGTWTGSASTVTLTSTAQVRMTTLVIYLESTEPSVELDPSSATSVSMLKGDSDTSVKVLVKNIETKTWSFTYDEDDLKGLTISSYINVSAGAAVEDVHTLTITTKATGTTTLHISVSGTACATSIPVTVNPKPASMTIVHADIVAGHLEIETGKYKQVSFSGEDTDGNAYAIAAADVNGSVTSGNSFVTLSGTRITGTAVGTAVVRYTLNALTSVYAEVTIDVRDDYKTTVNSITFNSNLTAKQGDTVDTSEVFATKVANTHFGTTAEISDSELLFSYDNSRASAIEHEMFSYDFTHGTVVDTTHKSQTIYVFVTFDENYEGTNFAIEVEQKNDPLTAITLTNEEIVDDEVDIARGGSLQLAWVLTPENPTDTRELQFSVDDQEEGVDISVSQSGLITIGANSDLGSATILVEAKFKTSVYTNLMVNVTLESMTYTVREEESWAKVTDDSTLSAGDVIMVTSDAKGKVLGEFSGNNKYANEGTATFDSGAASDVDGALEFTLETGSESGTWKLKNGTKYLYGTSAKTTLCLSDTSVDVTITISSGNATIDFGSGCRILHNVSSTRFSNYTSDTTTTMLLPQIYRKSGGDVQMNVTEQLFNAVHNNFGENKTYEWSASCSTFQSGKWATAGSAITGLSGYANLKLNRAVANASGNEIEQFLAKYDYIIGKTALGASDFLGRFAEGGINYKGANTLTPSGLFLGENASSAILIVSIISISALGGYFFLRRRKEQ